MDVEIRDLQLLEALDQHHTLTAAAEHLFVSQPALSQRLVRLEERLGTRLFERRGRRLVVTEAGTRMLRASRITLHELRDAVRDVHQLASGTTEVVRLWSQCSTNYHWLGPVLRRFRQLHPTADAFVEDLDGDQQVEALLDGRLDVAVVTKLDPTMDQVRLHRLFDDELLVIVGDGHRWAGQASVVAADFAEAHLILFDSYDQTRTPAVPLPLPPGAVPGRVTTLPLQPDVLIETVIGREAATVLPSWLAAPYLTSGDVRGVSMGPTPLSRTWYGATRRGPLPDHLITFLDLLAHQGDET